MKKLNVICNCHTVRHAFVQMRVAVANEKKSSYLASVNHFSMFLFFVKINQNAT